MDDNKNWGKSKLMKYHSYYWTRQQKDTEQKEHHWRLDFTDEYARDYSESDIRSKFYNYSYFNETIADEDKCKKCEYYMNLEGLITCTYDYAKNNFDSNHTNYKKDKRISDKECNVYKQRTSPSFYKKK